MGQKNFHVKSVDFSRGRVTFLFDHAKTADSNGFNTKIPYFAPPHAYLISWDPLWWQKRKNEHTWAHMSKHEQAWARMLNPLILTGLTPKSPILPLHMLIWYHETLYGDKKEKMSTHEHTWASMSKNAKSADSSRFNIEIPYFGPPHAYLTSWDPLWWQKRACELTWASMSKMSKHELKC